MFYQSYQNILWADAVQKYCEVSKNHQQEIYLCNFGQNFGKLVVSGENLLYMEENSNLLITA